MPISEYSTTAIDNEDAATGVNFTEGQASSTLNNSMRQVMVDIRSWYDDAEWRDLGHAVTRTANTTFTIGADVTTTYEANRPIRCEDSSTLYGYIVSSTYSSPNTTVTVALDSGNLSASLTSVALGPKPSIKSIPVEAIRSTGVGAKFVKRKTADESVTSSTTLQDDDHLTFAIGASEEWVGNLELSVGASLSTTGIKVTLTAPSGATAEYDAIQLHFSPAGVHTNSGRSTTLGTAINFTTTVAADSAKIKMAFWILNSTTAGSVTLQFAQSTSIATGVTIRKGSFLIAHRVA